MTQGGQGSLRLRSGQAQGRACGLMVMVCLLVVLGRGMGWAQGSEPAQNSGQSPAPDASQNAPPNTPQNTPPNSGQAPAKELPDAPGASKKDESGNPVVAVADKTKDVATAGLLKARDWESGWIAGVYVGRNRKLVTLTAEQREDIYLRQTLTTPSAYMKRMFGALIDQARGTPWQWGGGWGGYGKRFASREGQFVAANSLAAVGNAALRYEVRYDKCKCDGLWPRTRHAFIRNLVTYDRSEEHLRPQFALYGGAFAGGMISTTWKPGSHNAFAEGGQAAVEQIGWGTLLNFFTEFSREINRKQGVK